MANQTAQFAFVLHFTSGNGASYAIASDYPMDARQGRAPELWWVVDDVAAFREMSTTSEVSSPLRQMPFGIWDPAGQVHNVLEFARRRPSEAVA